MRRRTVRESGAAASVLAGFIFNGSYGTRGDVTSGRGIFSICEKKETRPPSHLYSGERAGERGGLRAATKCFCMLGRFGKSALPRLHASPPPPPNHPPGVRGRGGAAGGG